MKNYKITCPSIFIAHLIYKALSDTCAKYTILEELNGLDKIITFNSNLELEHFYKVFCRNTF